LPNRGRHGMTPPGGTAHLPRPLPAARSG
jgi:hypothetical protein